MLNEEDTLTNDDQASASSTASLHVPHGQDRVHHHSGRRHQEADPAGFQRQDLDPRDAPAGHRQGGQAARRRHTGRNRRFSRERSEGVDQ